MIDLNTVYNLLGLGCGIVTTMTIIFEVLKRFEPVSATVVLSSTILCVLFFQLAAWAPESETSTVSSTQVERPCVHLPEN
jgi:hypothetical protein